MNNFVCDFFETFRFSASQLLNSQPQERGKSMDLLGFFAETEIKYPDHSGIPKALADFKQILSDSAETAMLGRTILVETVFVLSFKIIVETKDVDKKPKALEKAKQLIREQIAVVTQGLDGVNSGTIQPGLWALANDVLK